MLGDARALDAILDEHEDGELEAALDGPWDEYRPGGKSLHHKAEASMGAVAALRPFAASARSANGRTPRRSRRR